MFLLPSNQRSKNESNLEVHPLDYRKTLCVSGDIVIGKLETVQPQVSLWNPNLSQERARYARGPQNFERLREES